MIFKQIAPGVFITAAIAAVAFAIKYLIGFQSPEMMALIIGIALGNIFSMGNNFMPGVIFSEKKLLSWAVALLGLQLSFRELSLSIWVVPLLILLIFIAIFLGKWLAPKLGVSNNCGFFIGVGNAICGASAIAAVSPFFKTESHHTGVSIGVVNLLGVVGMLALPALSAALGFSASESGLLIGGSLQAVGQVVAGGYALGDEVGQIATLVKLGRVLMLAPVVIITAVLMRKKNSEATSSKKLVPGFLIVFLILLLLTNIFNIPESVVAPVKLGTKILLTVAMAGIGLRININDLLKQGPKAVLLGAIIFIVQIAVILFFIYGQRMA